MTTQADRLSSIRTRIVNIRTLLDSPNSLTSVSAGGISETIDRSALRAELRELEQEEDRLTGKTRRLRKTDMSGC